MKSGLYVIFDKIGQIWTAPLSLMNDAAAIRYFKTAIKENIGDYKLVKLGEYDNTTGVIVLCESFVVIDGDSYGKN